MSFVTVTDSYSDVFMACPPDVENGPKEALVERAGRSERMLSDPRTGEWSGGTFEFDLIDDGRFRRQRASLTDRYWKNVTIKMTTRGNRAIKGPWYTVFNGPITGLKPTRPKGYHVTLGDIVSKLLITDRGDIPFRKIGDGFIDASVGIMAEVSEHLDRDTPEPQIYGVHRRIPNVDPASPQGFCVLPIYLGIRTVSGTDYHVWMIAGHAVSDIPFWNVIDPDGTVNSTASEGGQWLVPHYAGYLAEFGAPYEDLRSSTYGIDRRYTLMYGLVTDLAADIDALTDPDACALGHKQLTVAVEGVEDVGDGSGTLITDRIQQYKHWLINYVANSGLNGYQSGAWLTNPTWDIFGSTVDIIHEASFDAASAIAELRLPANDYEPTAGYIGAAVVGQSAGDAKSAAAWIAEWNRSCGLMNGITRKGQYKVVMLSPTQAIKDAAPLYNDQNHIVRSSFDEDEETSEQANVIPFQADFNPSTGVWVTRDSFTWPDSIDREGNTIPSEVLNYRFAPGITQAYHLARIEGLRSLWPPKRISIETNLLDKHNDSLAYRELGDYIRVQSRFAIANSTGEERLYQITKIQVQVGARKVLAEALDCEDFIGAGGALSYDRPPQDAVAGGPGGGGGGTTTQPPGGTVVPLDNFTMFDAIVINPEANSYEVSTDTSFNPTDPNIVIATPSPSAAPHAAWWTITPTVNKQFSFSTLGSSYDTQLAVFSADPSDPYGTVAQEGYNDNISPTNQSAVTINLTANTTYYILVAGVAFEDGGILRFRAVAPEVGDLYVSTAGRTGASGAIDDPFRTLNEALTVIATLGEGTIIMRGGVYDENIHDPIGLTASSWANKIRIASFPGEIVWLRPTANDTMVIFLSSNDSHPASYVEFDGINLDWTLGADAWGGLKIGDMAHHIRFMNAEIKGRAGSFNPVGHFTGAGVLVVQSQNGLQGGIELLNLVVHGGGYTDFDHGFYIQRNTTIVDGCEVYDMPGGGIQVGNNYATALYDCIIRNNYIHDLRNTGSGQRHWGILATNYCQNGQFYNNVIVRVPSNGYSYDGQSMGLGTYSTGYNDNKFWNNTVYNCAGAGILIDSLNTGCEVKNNISYGNAVTNYADFGSGTVTATNLFTNPLFVNPAADDYRLQAGSAAIDAGTTLAGVATDRRGIQRPQGGAYDIGAYEYVTP